MSLTTVDPPYPFLTVPKTHCLFSSFHFLHTLSPTHLRIFDIYLTFCRVSTTVNHVWALLHTHTRLQAPSPAVSAINTCIFELSHQPTPPTLIFAFLTFTMCFHAFLTTVNRWQVLIHTRTLLQPSPAIYVTQHSFPSLYIHLWPPTLISSPFPVFSIITMCFYAFTMSVDPLQAPDQVPKRSNLFSSLITFLSLIFTHFHLFSTFLVHFKSFKLLF